MLEDKGSRKRLEEHSGANKRVVVATAAAGVIGLFIVLSLFRVTVLTAQRNCLRNVVRDVSGVMLEYNMDYWWDFGTLLGLVREGDIIFTEVDADISIPLSTRDKFFDNENFLKAWDDLGYTIEKRDDEGKLRLYGPWGWVADMDVWWPATNHTLNMRTGRDRIRPARYILPEAWLLPTQARADMRASAGATDSSMAQLGDSLPGTLRVPAQPRKVLVYWYGDTWITHRPYYKGNDPATDALENFMWKHATWLYEIAMCLKYTLRILLMGYAGVVRGVVRLPTAMALLPFIVMVAWVRQSAANRALLAVVTAGAVALVTSALLMVVTLALAG